GLRLGLVGRREPWGVLEHRVTDEQRTRTADDEEAGVATGLRQRRQAVEPDSMISARAARAGRGPDEIVSIGHARIEVGIGDIADERAGSARYLGAGAGDGGDFDSAGDRLGGDA